MHLLLLGLLLTILCTGYKPPTRIVWLNELDLTNVDQSAGKALANQSMWRTPLSISGEVFKRGVGTHAAGVFRVKLDGRTVAFKAAVGIDDSAPEHELKQASAEFIIIGDGKIIWRSGVMHGRQKAKKLAISTKGIHSLILWVDHAGDGIAGDRADWVNARFEVEGANPVSVKRKREKEYVLSPVPQKQPHINAPYILGARAGNPFLFTIPVSGERPVHIIARDLPDGLSVDERTGIITGKAAQNGTYKVTVTAKNGYGTDTKELTIEIGKKINRTPPMGWNSWNVFGADISDQKIRDMTDALVALGLNQYGYAYINIDDGWQGQRGGKFNAIMPNKKFPDMKALVDYVHSKGLKIGIYSSPWVQTYAGYTGSSADTPEGKIINASRRYGAVSFAKQDVQQWAAWGFDYVKYDWVTNDIAHTAELSYLFRQSGRDITLSISNAAPFELAEDWSRLANAWRTTGDIHDSWCSMTTIGFLQNKWQPFAKPGSWNDPDMLVLGKLGWGKDIHTTNLTPDEQYTHITLWSLLAAPLLIGCDLKQMDAFTLSLLTNREVIAVDQDAAGIQGQRVAADREKETEIWSRPLGDGSIAVGLFNLSDNLQELSIDWKQLHLNGKQRVRNIWQQKDLGVYSKNYTSEVPAHGVVFLKIRPGFNCNNNRRTE
ncbi:alpha-galactosidase [Niabella ginsenosidivorans]|uniref:Alpha-galactosidase n=2 Tax=Niabella ginsenosidivorans TaxID=1176587 RepID=A0A1A9I7M4_9BACT|nr:alpha-galactosidase [Niabella ginsenosidivorans]